MRKRGFTLIELLIVIAIIGILAAIALAALDVARSKGKDAAIQSDLNAIRTQAAIYYRDSGGNGYGPAESGCVTTVAMNMFSDPHIRRAVSAADSVNGDGTVTCNVGADSYAVSAQLVADTSKYWCVDSTGVGRVSSSPLGLATVCP